MSQVFILTLQSLEGMLHNPSVFHSRNQVNASETGSKNSMGAMFACRQ